MSYASANGIDLIGATVCLPRSGVWTADLYVDTEDASKLGGAVSIVLGSLQLSGTAHRVGSFTNKVTLRVVGGAAGLGGTVKPKGYRSPTVRVVLNDILADATEKVSSTIAATLLATQLPAWVRIKQAASAQLTRLAEHIDATWRVLPDGTVWLGVDTWPTATLPDERLEQEWPQEGRARYGVDDFTLLPGTTLNGQQVEYVEHRVAVDVLETDVWFAT